MTDWWLDILFGILGGDKIVKVLKSQSQSQSYFTIGGLPPISSSWCQALWESRPELLQLNPCDHSPYVTFSLTGACFFLLSICLDFYQVYESHIKHVTVNSSCVSPDFAKQIIPILVEILSPRYIAPVRTAQNTSLPLLHVFSLLGKQVINRAVP
jgi:hypothetical protein